VTLDAAKKAAIEQTLRNHTSGVQGPIGLTRKKDS
jgi:hypothetical protein